MNETEEKLREFKNKICQNCKQKECIKGIVIVKYKDALQIKCVDYIPKEPTEKYSVSEAELYCKFKERKKNSIRI